MTKQRQTLRIPNGRGQTLAAKLELPAGEPRAYAVFAHCFTCGKDLKTAVRISRGLTTYGFAVLRFDFTGLGQSEGDFGDTGYCSNLDDLEAVADYLREHYEAPTLLVGHSLGGAAVIEVAARIPEVRAVATLGAPANTTHLRDTLLRRAPELAEGGSAPVTLGGRTFQLRRDFLEDLEQDRVQEAAANLRKPLLIFHSPVDEVVGIEHATKLFVAAKHPKSFVSLDRSDHLMLEDPQDAELAANVLAAWALRYATTNEPYQPGPRHSVPHGYQLQEGEVWAQLGPEGFRTEVSTLDHHLVVDEPETLGGTNTGPTPYDYLLAALGACTVMTMRMYAQRKGWDLNSAGVHLSHDKLHAKDCYDCETREGMVDEITREISLEGALNHEQRQRLMDIANKCPVHRTLHSEIKVRTRLRDDSEGDGA